MSWSAVFYAVWVSVVGVSLYAVVYQVITDWWDTRRFRRGFAADDLAAEKESKR